MTSNHDSSKRDFMKTVLGVGGVAAAAGLAAGAASVRNAHAQLLESGIDPKSVLANIKKEGKLRLGFSQTAVWLRKNPKTGNLEGVYHDVGEALAKAIEVETEWHEVTWANSTIGLRKGDYDIFATSLFYTLPRSLVVNYVGPMWRKGRLVVSHKDQADRFRSAADFNSPDVTFSINVGSSEENWVMTTFPKAKIITTTGQSILSAEPVRAKKADLYASGDSDILKWIPKNPWAHIIDPDHPIGLTANTWAIRYGDPAWKNFLDFWAQHVLNNGFMKERYEYHLNA